MLRKFKSLLVLVLVLPLLTACDEDYLLSFKPETKLAPVDVSEFMKSDQKQIFFGAGAHLFFDLEAIPMVNKPDKHAIKGERLKLAKGEENQNAPAMKIDPRNPDTFKWGKESDSFEVRKVLQLGRIPASGQMVYLLRKKGMDDGSVPVLPFRLKDGKLEVFYYEKPFKDAKKQKVYSLDNLRKTIERRIQDGDMSVYKLLDKASYAKLEEVRQTHHKPKKPK